MGGTGYDAQLSAGEYAVVLAVCRRGERVGVAVVQRNRGTGGGVIESPSARPDDVSPVRL